MVMPSNRGPSDATPTTAHDTEAAETTIEATRGLGHDLLRGADEIAQFVFGDAKHRRKVYYLTGDAKRGMPYFKIGSLTCARKSTLLRWIAEQENRR